MTFICLVSIWKVIYYAWEVGWLKIKIYFGWSELFWFCREHFPEAVCWITWSLPPFMWFVVKVNNGHLRHVICYKQQTASGKCSRQNQNNSLQPK
jgi:hypothetical protein